MSVHFWSEQYLRINNARHNFRKVEDIELLNKILQMQSDDENLDAMRNEPHYLKTIFGWDIKTRSMHDEYLGWLINYLRKSIIRNHDLKLRPASCVLLPLYQLLDIALKSSVTTVRYGFLLKINSRFNSRFLTNVSSSSLFWLGELYKQIRLYNLRSIVISKTMHSWSIETLSICTGQDDLK